MEKNKVWLDENGIINVKIEEMEDEKDFFAITDAALEIGKQLPKEAIVLVILDPIKPTFIGKSEFRKKAVKKINDMFENPGYKKIALIGGSSFIRTVTSFIVAASGRDNIKFFKTKEEAIRWLKES